MITIKNSNRDICDYRIPYIDIDITEQCKNFKKIVDEIRQKFIDITGIPKNRLNKQYENN